LKYTRMIKEEAEPIITVGEYILETDSEAFREICRIYMIELFAGVGQYMNEYLPKTLGGFRKKIPSISEREIDELMREPPKPGRGGLLPWEGEEALHD